MLGDTAVAVNPQDKRYKNLIGQTVTLPIQNREIPIIADSAVDQKFGTGAVKVTPGHDLTDWEIGLRHKLKVIKVMNEKGEMTKESKICQGLDVLSCREKVLKELEEKKLIATIEDYDYPLPYCYRCHSLIEPLASKQWFLKMNSLAKAAIKSVRTGKVKFVPKGFEKVYFDWLKNIKDWCISRQLWWGHKIPIQGVNDVLDTWFSSALWPFATLGWPNNTRDLKTFYPTDVLITDRGIINLWVARMIFSGIEFMKKEPFHRVLIHATVLTREGKRMSKSLGTGIDPINLIERYGADATRFGIAFQIMGGQDMKFVEDNIVMGRKFCNKLWNAARFVLLQIANSPKESPRLPTGQAKFKNLTPADKRILKTLEKTIKSVNKDLENYEFGKAAHVLYDFFWHDFCDIYIEKSKAQEDKGNTQKILLYVLATSLKLLHPFIPFITEEIYQKLPIHPVKSRKTGISSKTKLFNGVKNKKRCLMIESWPK